MSEIVVAEPIYDGRAEEKRPVTRYLTMGSGSDQAPEPFESERLPATLASKIQSFLRVANLIESEEPRIAYLCRFHAFEIAHNMDRHSNGRGVRQFKTTLLQRLEQDEETTLRKRKEKSDMRELRRVYHAYKEYIIKHEGAFNIENSHREKLINARIIGSVLFEVLKTVSNTAGPQALANRGGIQTKPYDLFGKPYNILPLDQGGTQQPIMQLPEIKAAVAAIRNIRGIPSNDDLQKHGNFIDLFDFLQYCFGFQEGNVANQREHLLLLLANIHKRKSHKQTSVSKLGDAAVDELMRRVFKNYTNWCKFLGSKSNIRLPYVKQEAQQYKLLFLGLYLLIWGEAANLRFMPECLCYIFHHMAYELHGMLTGAVSLTTWEKVMPAYGGQSESFLNNVVTPIYEVIREEAKKSKGGTADHSTWRNYDDLNEYFWSSGCFEIGWPMRLDHDFFCTHTPTKSNAKNASASTAPVEDRREEDGEEDEVRVTKEEVHEPKWLGKTNFVEVRSFWQIFRSFDRMWSFFIVSLQALIIMACHELESPLQIFDKEISEDIMSIFITSAFLKFIQVTPFLKARASTIGTEVSPAEAEAAKKGLPSPSLIMKPHAAELLQTEPSTFSMKKEFLGASHLIVVGGFEVLALENPFPPSSKPAKEMASGNQCHHKASLFLHMPAVEQGIRDHYKSQRLLKSESLSSRSASDFESSSDDQPHAQEAEKTDDLTQGESSDRTISGEDDGDNMDVDEDV